MSIWLPQAKRLETTGLASLRKQINWNTIFGQCPNKSPTCLNFKGKFPRRKMQATLQAKCSSFWFSNVHRNNTLRTKKHSKLPLGTKRSDKFQDICLLAWPTVQTSAMDRKSLWSNRRPRPWTTLFKTHAPWYVCWLWLEPAVSRAFFYSNPAVVNKWARTTWFGR